MDFLSNLERLMDEYNMNRSDLARACGLSISTVHTWWNRGYENISMQTLIKLTKCLNCTLDELVCGVKQVYVMPSFGSPQEGVVYTSKDFTQDELKLISLYADFLKSIRKKGGVK